MVVPADDVGKIDEKREEPDGYDHEFGRSRVVDRVVVRPVADVYVAIDTNSSYRPHGTHTTEEKKTCNNLCNIESTVQFRSNVKQ